MNLTALQSPGYRRYLAGSTAAVNGLWILRVVLVWLAWDVSESATFVGLIAALTMIPTMISGPVFGALMDRMNIIRAAYGTNLGMMAAAISIIAALYLGLANKTFLIFLAICIGIISSAHHPMRLTMGPRLVDKSQISSVSALAALNFNTARVISPFIAGLIIEHYSVAAALVLALVLYLPNLVIYATLEPRILEKRQDYQSIGAAIREGFAYIWAHKYLRLILLTSAVYAVSIRALLEILPVVADGTFGKGATGLGQMAAAVGIGSLIAALMKTVGTSERIPAFSNYNLLIGVLGTCAAATLAGTGLWPIALMCCSCMGYCATHLGVSFQAEIQSDLPDSIRGRVTSLWGMVALGSVSLGSLLIGWMADTIGLGTTGFCVAVASLIVLGFVTIQSRKLD
jgi:MFS family permease